RTAPRATARWSDQPRRALTLTSCWWSSGPCSQEQAWPSPRRQARTWWRSWERPPGDTGCRSPRPCQPCPPSGSGQVGDHDLPRRVEQLQTTELGAHVGLVALGVVLVLVERHHGQRLTLQPLDLREVADERSARSNTVRLHDPHAPGGERGSRE